MLTRARARATNQHIFVDDKWNDAYIQTKDEQIDMLQAQRVLKSWEEDHEHAEDSDADDSEDDDRWISEDDSDDEEDDDVASQPTKQKQRHPVPAATWLAGGGFLENVGWTMMAAGIAPMLTYALANQCSQRRRPARRRTEWPLQSGSLFGTLMKAYTNLLTLAVVVCATYYAMCSRDVFYSLFTRPFSVSLASLQSARVCQASLLSGWHSCVGGSTSFSAQVLLSPDCLHHSVFPAAVLTVMTLLLANFHRFWLKALVLTTTLTFLLKHGITELEAERRAAIEIFSLDPSFAFVNERIFVVIDGQNLEQGAEVAWAPYWGGLQQHKVHLVPKLYASRVHNGGVFVTFDQLNEFVPCYRRRPVSNSDDQIGYKCFEHLRVRVKDQRSVPGWSLLTPKEDRDL
ncbi:hypothetical protein Poli38472_007419 [Pythium oligandrum]|uniref:Transmembrane protein n=1 Tax=Pythium oligandrum TaxID=41045 RepID=A0A8K1CQ48_PYTOL|nr:hypothetical protein Poli38472_007419 [Pythium oligandrum]|eukprot:TMW67747.1 hypothetical protein Poli38472_007419 [Pythium oligandrum]